LRISGGDLSGAVLASALAVSTSGGARVKLTVTTIAVFWLALSAASVRAQGLGVRAGASRDPNQFYAGVHYEAAEVVDRLRFRPNVEVGLGDNLTLVAMNIEFTYRLRVPVIPMWQFYVGGGPALNILRFTNNTDPEGGFNVLAGLSHRTGLFTEVKFGALKSPSFKLGVGYTFHR
jgi:hypothetical protein